MKKRVRISRAHSRRLVRKGLKTETRNVMPPVQRGGIRL